MPAIDVGRSLRIARAKANWTNVEIAEKLGITAQRVSDVANNPHASTRTVEKLAALFGMPVDEFIRMGIEE